jgi:FtsH-binding integral membrane protein
MITDLMLWLPALLCLVAAIVSAIIGITSDKSALAWLAHALFVGLFVGYILWMKRKVKSTRHS